MCFQPHEKRLDCLPEEIRIPREADVLFFVSCIPAYIMPTSVLATAKILDAAGVRWNTLGKDEWCCGYPMLEYGMLKMANAMLRHNVNAINRAVSNIGVKKMTTSCPACTLWFKIYPAKFGMSLNVEVLHTTELFYQLIKEGKLRFKEWKTTCVHNDACALGRAQGVYQEPRESLKAIPGLHLVEAESNRDQTLCCGSVPWYTSPRSFPIQVDSRHIDMAHKIMLKRVQQLEETGADTVIAACTGCVRVIGDMMKDRQNKTEVMLISEALARSLI